jgi:hypothetical protein
MAVLLDEARADFYMTQAAMQALLRLFATLAPVGRLLGYEPLQSEGRRDASTTMVGGVAAGGGLLFLMLWWRRHIRTS